METKAILPERGRDLRLDLFRGIANWAIFLNHMPENSVNWITNRNYGFSDAADLFVFISGYTASLVYARMMLNHGFITGATRLFKRVWQLYVAHIVLFVLYLVSVGILALLSSNSEIVNEFNVAGPRQPSARDIVAGHGPAVQAAESGCAAALYRAYGGISSSAVAHAAQTGFGYALVPGALCRSEPVRLEFAGIPGRSLVFQPVCVAIAVCIRRLVRPWGAWPARADILKSTALICLAGAYLLLGLVMTMAGRFPDFGNELPQWLFDAFNPNDKTNLAPYRFLHFVAAAFLVTKILPKDWPGLKSKVFAPAIKCGQQSLPVFCVGVFLSFIGHFALTLSSGSIMTQVLIAVIGVLIMIAVAYYVSWSKQQDKLAKSPAVPAVKPI